MAPIRLPLGEALWKAFVGYSFFLAASFSSLRGGREGVLRSGGGLYSANNSVLRYLSPVSGKSTTMFLPANSGRLANSEAA